VSEPVQVSELLPGVLGELVDRASHGYERWAELVAQAGYCHHPIRLAGRVEQADRTTGEVRTVYDSEREPDGVLLKACGTRRESRCPSCAATYRADAYQLLAAGLRGGKGVPETISEHPRLFVTFTAPSFGRVHSRRAQGRLVLSCHPYRQGARCPHGTRDGCWHRHAEDDPRLGEPLCPSCYDTHAQVLWNALAPELWRRTTIALGLGAGSTGRAGAAPAAGLGAHTRIWWALVDQEPPLLDHLHRPAPGPGRLRQAPPGPRRRSLGCLESARGRPGRARRCLLGVRGLGL